MMCKWEFWNYIQSFKTECGYQHAWELGDPELKICPYCGKEIDYDEES